MVAVVRRRAALATAIGAAVAVVGATSADATSSVASQRATAAQSATSKVIVILRDQLTREPAIARAVAARGRLERFDRTPLATGVLSSGGRVTHEFRTLNAFSATVTPAEAAALAANPAVADVAPDATVALNSAPTTPTRVTP